MTHDWKIYYGNSEPHDTIFPEGPPWRQFAQTDGRADKDVKFVATEEMVLTVNAALHLRRPLLITGRPGSGKSSLIAAVAQELKMGVPLRWHITSHSVLQDGLYYYDAIGRLQMQQLEQGKAPRIEDYLRLGPLGTALAPSERPRAILIDEIDKSDVDLPGDLLDVLERGEFVIPELMRMRGSNFEIRGSDEDQRKHTIDSGVVRCTWFPFVVLTSNGERDFPPAFLRRCVRLRIPDPTPEMLSKVVEAQLGPGLAEKFGDMINDFAANARTGPGLATDQLLNAVFLASQQNPPSPEEQSQLRSILLQELTSDFI